MHTLVHFYDLRVLGDLAGYVCVCVVRPSRAPLGNILRDSIG